MTAAIATVGDLIDALTTLDRATPVGVLTGRAGIVPLVVEVTEVRGPHPGWAEESGLAAVGFNLGTKAALYHERKGGALVTVARITEAGGPTPAEPPSA